MPNAVSAIAPRRNGSANAVGFWHGARATTLKATMCALAGWMLTNAATADRAAADTFVLAQGGKLEGTLLNPDEEPRAKYLIKTAEGIHVALDTQQVKQVIPESAAERRYRELLTKMPATADGNWKMAQWCQQNQLPEKSIFHTREVLRFEPDHEEARRALGFRRLEGRWVHPDDWMREQGFVRHNGKWRLPQDIELEQAREKSELAQKQWRKQVRSWRAQIGRGRAEREAEALQSFQTIDDPLAAVAVAELLEDEQDLAMCRVYIEVLGRLQNSVATRALIHTAINHRDGQVREAALEPLARYASASAARVFRSALFQGNRRHMLNAAVGLGRMGRPEAIPDLIDVLVTKHKVQIRTGPPGQIGASFGTGGSGLSVGAKPQIVEREMENQEVLDALLALIDEQVNFLYDQDAWRAWYVQSKAPPPDLSLRRSQ